MAEKRLFVISGCRTCPNLVLSHTPGTGMGLDWSCSAVKKDDKNTLIKGYVETQSEQPKDGEFPKFCPLTVLPNF